MEWAVKDSNLRKLMLTDLQSVPVGHLGNRPEPLDYTGYFDLWIENGLTEFRNVNTLHVKMFPKKQYIHQG
jgi:hypothetical protein